MSNGESDFDERFQKFADELRQKKVTSSCSKAITTVSLLKDIVCQNSKWENAQELIDIIRREGRTLMDAQQSEAVVGNMIKRVLKIIREDYDELKKKEEESKVPVAQEEHVYTKSYPKLKDIVNDSITELLEELDQSIHSIACEALNHIHSKDVIMTIGKSNTVEKFLKAAAKKRKFQVLVAEGAPFYHGQELAVSLADDNIETTVITDSAIFAMMSRATKVIIGTHTVMADGGLRAVSGSHAMALAAKHYSVPFIVCSAVYKLSTQYLHSTGQDDFNKFVSPHYVTGIEDEGLLAECKVVSPIFDYVPPGLVTLFIFNIGGNAPSYIYRLLSEMYHPDDHDFATEEK